MAIIRSVKYSANGRRREDQPVTLKHYGPPRNNLSIFVIPKIGEHVFMSESKEFTRFEVVDVSHVIDDDGYVDVSVAMKRC